MLYSVPCVRIFTPQFHVLCPVSHLSHTCHALCHTSVTRAMSCVTPQSHVPCPVPHQRCLIPIALGFVWYWELNRPKTRTLCEYQSTDPDDSLNDNTDNWCDNVDSLTHLPSMCRQYRLRIFGQLLFVIRVWLQNINSLIMVWYLLWCY